jgi:hypothetical protein
MSLGSAGGLLREMAGEGLEREEWDGRGINRGLVAG